MPMKKKLSVPDQHTLKVALETLKMSPAMLGVMGGPTKAEARATILRLRATHGDNTASYLRDKLAALEAEDANDPTSVDYPRYVMVRDTLTALLDQEGGSNG